MLNTLYIFKYLFVSTCFNRTQSAKTGIFKITSIMFHVSKINNLIIYSTNKFYLLIHVVATSGD